MDNNDLYQKTKQLLKQLNYFIFHVIIYFVTNIAAILLAFEDIQSRWWLLFFVVVWALVLLYHGLRIYGINPFSRKNNNLKQIWSWF